MSLSGRAFRGSLGVEVTGPAQSVEATADVVVSVQGVSKVFRSRAGERVVAAKDVTFDIAKGSTLGLVGESGSGKSTVGRILTALETPDAGQVRVLGADPHAMRPKELRTFRRNMQTVLQDPFASLNRRMSVSQILQVPLRVHQIADRRERARRVSELLDLVGLPASFAGRRPHEMSGGQCQRVGIARALAVSPRLMVLDESVSAVDVCVQAQILNLLRELQRELELTYLFVSHNLAVVRYMSDDVAVMYRGEIVEQADRETLFASPTHEYTHALLSAIPRVDRARAPVDMPAVEITRKA